MRRHRTRNADGDSPGGDSPVDDSIAQVTEVFVRAVDTVAARTTGPLLTAVRALVYGMVIVLTAAAALTLVVIALVRLGDTWIGGDVWVAYLIAAAVFGLLGAWLWSRRRR
ncbi:MAG TPA: hypothetical protein DEP66_04885 [Acidimicrobiaceae bacterium]|nr:hypothetical protein [Acidimicrobiaceae bacterium]HCB37533.1 hypothetical protein [Acidimicrobiaceae bacterium]